MRIAWICLALSGCFYFDPINQRPSIDIHSDATDVVHHGDPVRLDAVYDDPDGQSVTFVWNVYACGDDGFCDVVQFADSTLDFVDFKVPAKRMDGSVVASVRATLDAIDDLGATAKPQQELVIPTANAAPDITTRKRGSFVVDQPMLLDARIGDVDDFDPNPNNNPLVVVWQVFPPNSQPAYDFVDKGIVAVTNDPDHVTQEKMLTPHGIGAWTVQVKATDPRNAVTTQTIDITVMPDQPPCLGQWAPEIPPPGQTLPITDPTLFQVPIVVDDLDPYPALDDLHGVTRFAWSLKRNSGPRQVQVGTSGNSLDFDPAAFTPGDIVEIRVEIFDRNNNSLAACGDAATCAITTDTMCLQRQTWRVEAR